MKKRRVSEHPLFFLFCGHFGLLQRFISRDKIRYHGASAFPGGSRLPHGTVPACSKHRTGTARHSHCGGSYPPHSPFPGGMRWVSPFPLTRRTQSRSLPAKSLLFENFSKNFSRRACPRKTAKSAQQVATDLLGAEMFYKEDCLHGIVHIQSWTASMEGLCFF